MGNDRSSDPSGPADEIKSTRPSGKTIIAVVAVLAAAVFIAQNTEQGRVEFLFFEWTVGIWFGLLVAFLLGLLTGWFLPKLRRRSKAKNNP